MKIVVAHNFYQQPGGEDQCVAAEVAMLEAHGHDVIQYRVSNDAIEMMGRVTLASRTIWSSTTYRELRHLFQEQRPHVVHFHNTFPLISPAAYYAARAERAAVIQTLHNFRLCCANALLFRDGSVCESCLGKKFPLSGIVHKCYRNNRAASAAVTVMVGAHRAVGTWRNAVDVYIALTEFGRRKLIEGGLPAEKIVVKPNFVYPDPGPGSGNGGYAIFIGRLSAEKGTETLLEAWRQLGGRLPLKVVGDGPMGPAVRQAAAADSTIECMGNRPLEEVYALLGNATVLILPSQCYETFARVVVEAFSTATPVIVSRLGAMAEIVEDGRTGLHFSPGDAADLAAKVRQLLDDPIVLQRMRRAAREEFDRKFTADKNHAALIQLYERAMVRSRGGELAP